MAEVFKYNDERFADIEMLRYRLKEFETLSLNQKLLVYYLSEAALTGRDILWHQNCRYNLPIRRMLEAVYVGLKNLRAAEDTSSLAMSDDEGWQAFEVYLKRVWFSNGIHHHYGMDKFLPAFSEGFLRRALQTVGYPADEELLRVIFDPDVLPKRVNQTEGEDLLQTSAMNYYAPDITQREAEDFYVSMKQAEPEERRAVPAETEGHVENIGQMGPPMYGMNSRLERDEQGALVERMWCSGGMYGVTIDRIIYWLIQAESVAESEEQRQVIQTLADFYRTGDLRIFDRYCIQWVQQTCGDVDFTNGFTEVYGDPLGLKASWEGYVNYKDRKATERTERLSRHAQWFEDHSPVDSRFKKSKCRGVSACVVTVAMLGGDLYPSSAIGINLPNSNWIRQIYGSKSVTLGNLTEAYSQAGQASGFREEFVIDTLTLDLMKRYEDDLDNLHTDLHECLGHGSGQLLPGTDPDALKAYGSTIEEARADLFALYYIADPKMVELGLVPDTEAYKSQYYSYMMNGLLTQLVRIEPGKQIEEAHMRNRALIARWVMEHSEGAMELVSLSSPNFSNAQDLPRTFLKINDYAVVRHAVGQLLAEVQRIKSEGDYEAARYLVEGYGVTVDAALHTEILQRYNALHLAPYKGFINPLLRLVRNAEGTVVDVVVEYGEAYADQMLRYSKDYSFEC
ncbi:MAG: dihydrofolate reductase [Bacteroidaceae bacterium]|nr:dihydrofolate reductase [Bacteroidaceae bacterium]